MVRGHSRSSAMSPFGAPVGSEPGGIPSDLWRQKTRIPGLSCGAVCAMLSLAVLVEQRLVTDTDRHRATAYTAPA